MISITSAQLDAFLLAWIFPMVRTLAMLYAAPIFTNRALSRRLRLAIGLAIGFAVAQAVPASPNIAPGSYLGLGILLQQILIGSAMGLCVRAFFAATDVAGEIIGLEMGLSFASFFDPQSEGQTVVVGQFLGLITSLIFLALNGHLILVEALVRSFEWLPVGQGFQEKGWLAIAHLGGAIFSLGVVIALPVVAALLIANISLAVLTRAAPQLNLFSLGFPITVSLGIILLYVALRGFAPVVENLVEQAFATLDMIIRTGAGR